MLLEHERLDVYAIALDLLVFSNRTVAARERASGGSADTSLDVGRWSLAKGAGKLSKADKRRHDLTARGSATESTVLLAIWLRLRL